MTRRTGRAALKISDDQRVELENLAGSRTVARREIERARILLRYARGENINAIGKALRISRPTIYQCVDNNVSTGRSRRAWLRGSRTTTTVPVNPGILLDAKAWLKDIACARPCDRGMVAELWTLSALARFVREHALAAGHPCLAKAGKATVWRILNAQSLKPHKIQYYLEQRDPDFAAKRQHVLLVYQGVMLKKCGVSRPEWSLPE